MSPSPAPRVHLIAIGGAVMHNLALALQRRGYRVTGSDDALRDPSRARLAEAGLLPSAEGWDPGRVTADLDGVILGMHARADNPELARARALGLPVWSFPEFVRRESEGQRRVAICGSHGKTSITAMTMAVLRAAGRDFDYLVGAQLAGYDVMVRLSGAPELILEGDEYLASPLDPRPKFAHYAPAVALLSGIAWDHVNVYPTYERYLDAFRGLLRDLGPEGHLVYNDEDPEVRALVGEGWACRLHPYACPPYRVADGALEAEVPGGPRRLRVIGRHNLLNAAGAATVAGLLDVPPADAWAALAEFPGAARRLEVLARGGGRTVIRDFAHAPSKVAASTAAVAEQFGADGLLACLELHTFSSLNPEFLPGYRGSLDAAGHAVVFFDPAAVALKRLPPLSPEAVRAALGREDLAVFTDAAALEAHLLERLPRTEALLMMSSGPFGGLDLPGLAARFAGGDPKP